MEEGTLRIFKGKFVVLTVLLNMVILLLAGGVLAYFMLGPEIKLPVSGLLFVMALALFAYFWKQYRKEKEWLDAHA
jgi:membrane protein implicated in regulation of membrane protease activity